MLFVRCHVTPSHEAAMVWVAFRMLKAFQNSQSVRPDPISSTAWTDSWCKERALNGAVAPWSMGWMSAVVFGGNYTTLTSGCMSLVCCGCPGVLSKISRLLKWDVVLSSIFSCLRDKTLQKPGFKQCLCHPGFLVMVITNGKWMLAHIFECSRALRVVD